MIFVKPAFATCPVCVVAVGSGLWLAEKLGVDDLIAAIWIGALLTAMAVAFADKFRRIRLPRPRISWTIISYILAIATLQIQGKLNNPYCRIWGVCKIWLGITIGTVVFWLGILLDQWLRNKNNNQVFFPFQKVIIPILATLLVSFVFYLAIC
jgi:hypothetical protein